MCILKEQKRQQKDFKEQKKGSRKTLKSQATKLDVCLLGQYWDKRRNLKRTAYYHNTSVIVALGFFRNTGKLLGLNFMTHATYFQTVQQKYSHHNMCTCVYTCTWEEAGVAEHRAERHSFSVGLKICN
jgi:hypothetical protein